jgi:uncharacterized YigZ family protein
MLSHPLILFCAAALPTASCRLLQRPYRSHHHHYHYHHHHHHHHHRRPPAAFLFLHPSSSSSSATDNSESTSGRPPATDSGVRSRLWSSSSSSSLSSSSGSPPLLKTLEGTDLYVAEEVVKKSRFVGYAARCSSWDEARAVIESVRDDHPKSRHVCFGYVSSGTGSTERSSDGGEPTGTAGAPILGAIKSEGLSDVLCVVVRYFGGIKLGAGGLIRAYGGSARLVLRSARTVAASPRVAIRLSLADASNVGAVYAAAARRDGAVVTTSGDGAYHSDSAGGMELTISCDEGDGARLMEDIVDATRGGVTFM